MRIIWLLAFLTTMVYGNKLIKRSIHDNGNLPGNDPAPRLNDETEFVGEFEDMTRLSNHRDTRSDDEQPIPANQQEASCEPNSSAINGTVSFVNALKSEFLKEILKRLGMESAPSVNKANMNEQETRQILRLYKKSIEELKEKTSVLFDEGSYFASQFHSYSDKGTRPEIRPSDADVFKEKKRIYFDIDIKEPSNPNMETIVETATLKIYKAYVKPDLIMSNDFVDRSIRVEIFQIVYDNEHMPPRFLKRSVASKLVSLDNYGWEEFDVSRAVQDWIADPLSNYGLEIVCDSCYDGDDLLHFVTWNETALRERLINPLVSFAAHFANTSYDSSFLPLLNVFTEEKAIIPGRLRRSLDFLNDSHDVTRSDIESGSADCTDDDGETRCCRYSFYISFRDLGWNDWIIEPDGFYSYYCYGDCPEGFKPATKYSELVARLISNDVALSGDVRRRLSPKCVPSELGPISIAHLNLYNLPIVSVFKNMIPLRCHCL